MRLNVKYDENQLCDEEITERNMKGNQKSGNMREGRAREERILKFIQFVETSSLNFK